MAQPALKRVPKTGMSIGGRVGDYVQGVTEQWLLIAPKANPGMLEMFRDRDATPIRALVPWAGEFAGKYLTSAVEVLRVTGDKRLKAWLKEFVDTLISLQDKDGYIGPWTKERRLTNTNTLNKRTWDTWGHYHIMLGLMLWHDETGDKASLSSACKIADLMCKRYLGKKKPRLVDTPSTEMNMAPAHSLCLLYKKTKTKRYLDMALQIVDEFSVKKKGEFLSGNYLEHPLTGKEFYESPKPRWESIHPIMALVELYYITGEERYREAFEKTWWSIVKLDRHNNGGFSSGEQATGNPYHQGAIETCCTIAWAAMSVEMLKLTGSSVVADELEFTFRNSIVGMHTSAGRWATYDTPMKGVRKASAHHIVFQAREGTPELNCCSVNSPRGFGMIGDWALLKDRDGLVLNYYGDSTFTAKAKPGVDVSLIQKTEYPRKGRITIDVKSSKASEFALRLRIPYWSSKTRVKLNGTSVKGVKAGEYLVIDRKWKRSGDTIQLDLDMSLHVWRGEKECKGLVSLYRGPILLTYDHRYNLDHASKTKQVMRSGDAWKNDGMDLTIPPLNLKTFTCKETKWDEWLPPELLFECKAANGKTVRLCDFGSAGEGGTPYHTWLPVKTLPDKTPFSRANPRRSTTF